MKAKLVVLNLKSTNLSIITELQREKWRHYTHINIMHHLSLKNKATVPEKVMFFSEQHNNIIKYAQRQKPPFYNTAQLQQLPTDFCFRSSWMISSCIMISSKFGLCSGFLCQQSCRSLSSNVGIWLSIWSSRRSNKLRIVRSIKVWINSPFDWFGVHDGR